MVSAARLNVSTRPAGSVVTNPMVRLLMMCSLYSLQVGDGAGGVGQPFVGHPDPFGQRSLRKPTGEEGEQVDADGVLGDQRLRQRHGQPGCQTDHG